MTEYSDIDQINALKAEQADLDRALTMLDDYDGTILSVVIAAVDPVPPELMMTIGTPVNIRMTDPAQAMISGVRAGLMQRYNEINRELEALGVTGVPPNWSGGGPSAAETQPA